MTTTDDTYTGRWSTANYQPDEKNLPYRCPDCVTLHEPVCPHRVTSLLHGAPPVVDRTAMQGFLTPRAVGGTFPPNPNGEYPMP